MQEPAVKSTPSPMERSPTQMISPSALQQLQKLYQPARDADAAAAAVNDASPIVVVDDEPTESSNSNVDNIPPAARSILQANRSHHKDQNINSRVKSNREIDAITADLSNVDLE